MLLFPQDIFATLEFTRIRELTAERCAGEPAAALALDLRPSADIRSVQHRLAEVHEWAGQLSAAEPIPFGPYQDIRDSFRYLEIEDYVLEPETLLHYRGLLFLHRDLQAWLEGEQAPASPSLHGLLSAHPFREEPLRSLNRVFDETGNVLDDASPALRQIRRRIREALQSLERIFAGLVQEYRKNGWLAEVGESIRNGRRVLIVPAEHKRRIKGIIHDESASGRTVFLEPERMVELNNDLFDLESEERQEIHRILRDLCNSLRPGIDYFRDLIRLIIRLDLIRARALVSRLYQGTLPEISSKLEIELRGARHPLLFLKHSETGRAVVPFDLHLDRKQRVLLLSGPNAGGKSVTMKSVMLIQIMVQSGFLVPAREGSRLPVFHKFFADIGDQQSLEDDLSTYSSRLRNLKVFLDEADRRTLIALDEFGAGTDPKIGGAIAEAILKALNRRQVMGVVTTHYSNLKIFAFRQDGLVNGAMVFDQEKLKPAYQLSVGKPGSSYAYEIAASSGLPEEVLDYARAQAGDASQTMERLLSDLQQERRSLEEQLLTAREKEQKLDLLIRNYESLFRDLEYQRKKHKIEVRELALQQRSREEQGVEALLKDLKEERRLEKVLERREALRQEQERLRSQVSEIRKETSGMAPPGGGTPPAEIKVGDFVRVRGGGAIGEVLEMKKTQVRVALGELVALVDRADLEWVGEPLDIRSRKSVQLNRGEEGGPSDKLDIRGFKKDDALRVLELFLDNALLSAFRSVRVLHGKGTGALRRVVMEKAREYKDIRAIEPAGPEEGGEGVTILRFV